MMDTVIALLIVAAVIGGTIFLTIWYFKPLDRFLNATLGRLEKWAESKGR